MPGVRQRLLGLCLPPLAFSAFDGFLTLAGQSAEYWNGAYEQVNEASPKFHQLLAIHPLAFAAGLCTWMFVFVGAILLVSDTIALILSIAVTFGHTVGAATWLLWRFQYGYQVCNGLFLLAAIMLGISIRWGWGAAPKYDYDLPYISTRARWALATVLFAIGGWLFLWPSSP